MRNIIYINKEDVNFIDIKTYKELNDYILSKSVDDRMNYIFVDEIQEIQDFRLAIRSLALDDNNDIYVTGSNSEIFSSDLANELGGRYVEFVVYSCRILNFWISMNWRIRMRHWRNIFIWRIALSDTFADGRTCCMEYLRSIYSTIILKDVIQRKNIRNTVFLEQLVSFLAGNIGNLFSSKSISDFLKSQKSGYFSLCCE